MVHLGHGTIKATLTELKQHNRQFLGAVLPRKYNSIRIVQDKAIKIARKAEISARSVHTIPTFIHVCKVIQAYSGTLSAR